MIMSPFVITCGCTTHHEPHGANGATCKSGGRIKVDSNMMSKKHKHALGLQCSQHAMTCPALCTALPCPVHCPALPCALPCPALCTALPNNILLLVVCRVAGVAIANAVNGGTAVHTATSTEQNALCCSLS